MHFYDSLGACHSTSDPQYKHLAPESAISLFLTEGYFPSATTILSIVRHPHLEEHSKKTALQHYLKYQDIELALRFEDSVAASQGSRLHSLCQKLFQNFILEKAFYLPEDTSQKEIRILSPLLQWAKAEVTQVHFSEKAFVHPAYGYAGTADLLVQTRNHGLLLTDFKFKGQTTTFPLKPTIEYAAQLCAYRNYFSQFYKQTQIQIGNLLIDSFSKNSGSIPSLKLITYKKDYTLFFRACHHIWKELHQFDAANSY